MDEFETEDDPHEHVRRSDDADDGRYIDRDGRADRGDAPCSESVAGRRPGEGTADPGPREPPGWRVGTTGLSPEDADRVWRWYSDVCETAVANGNRSRGVRAWFERAVLFPRRSERDHELTGIPEEWLERARRLGVSRDDVDRSDLLITRQGRADLPRPAVPSKRE